MVRFGSCVITKESRIPRKFEKKQEFKSKVFNQFKFQPLYGQATFKGDGGTSAPTVYNSLCLIIKNSIDDTKRSSNRLKKSHNKCTSPRTEVPSVIVRPLSSSTLSISFRFFVIKIDFNFRYEVSLNHFQLFAAY